MIVFLNGELLKDWCSDLSNYKHFISKSFYIFVKVMGWGYVISLCSTASNWLLRKCFLRGWRALFFIKWLWTLALQVLTLDLPFTLPHNSIQTVKWLPSLSSTCRGRGGGFPCAFLCILIKLVHSNERIPLFPKLPYSDPSFNAMLQHCVGKLGGGKAQRVKNGLGA